MPVSAWWPAGAGRILFCIATFAAALIGRPGPAHAECAGSEAIDTCLVGTWQSTGAGQVEWLRRNMPSGISLPRAERTGTITYGADGTYSAVSAGRQTALIETGDDRSRSDGHVTTTSAGRWSAAGGQLNICGTDHIAGSMNITTADGSRHTIPLSQPAAAASASFAYSCGGGVLETRKSFPGIADPMILRYMRIGASEGVPE